jgi:DNA (cytosine-5)-methyltransferase 1
MLASPACQGHTNARGKETPHHDALRSTAWAVVSAAECHQPKAIIVENVKEFRNWTLYHAWKNALWCLGYGLTEMVLDAADHGVPQHRLRYIGVAVKGETGPIDLKMPKRRHVPISTVVDFDSGRWSPIDNGRRAAATLARIAKGREAFGDRFIVPYYGSGSGQTGRSLDRPIGTLTTLARWAIIDGDRMRMLSVPEAKAAMGFRPDYQVPANIRTANFMLGNAVPPPMATDIIRAVLEAA